MTVTDEDKALFVSVYNIWPDSETAHHVRKNQAFSWEVEQIAKYRQAAYAAGLERAAVIAEERQSNDEELTAAIRAEKDKTNDRD
jgi:hypothetical protein